MSLIRDIEVVSAFISRTVLFFVFFSVSCSSVIKKGEKEGYQVIPESAISNVDRKLRIGASSKLRISVMGDPDLTEEMTVSSDGTIQYASLGEIDIQGLTLPEIEQKIASRLAKDYIYPPQVHVKLLEFGSIFVFGRVKNPGILRLKEPETVLAALATAGGFSETARKFRVRVLRRMKGEKKMFILSLRELEDGGWELAKPVYLIPGDTIFVD